MPGSIPASATADSPAPEVALGEPKQGARERQRRRPAVGTIAAFALTLPLAAAALFADQLAPGDPFAITAPSLRPPSVKYLLGTDNLGRDLFRAVVQGLRTSMTVVVGALLISSVIGIAVGALAGYRRGLIDDVLSRITETFQAVPRFFLALMTIALFGPGLKNLVILLGLTSWPLLARVVRAETLATEARLFVDAARSYGASDRRILVRHVVPNVLPAAGVVISLMASRVILLEATLSYLGLGDQNRMSLGYLANNAQSYLRISWWMPLFPGLAVAMTAIGFSLLSDALNDRPGRGRSGARRSVHHLEG